MRKYIKYVILFIFVILLFSANQIEASTGSTIFIGEPVILDNYKDIEITYNNVEINEETSEIKNTFVFTNLSGEDAIRKASIKLEDSFSNLTINSLKITVNDLEITEITKDEDNYIFYFKIPANEGKKIEISYKTDSNLQNAKIIKYTMDKLKGKNVKLFDIKIILSKYDIPLVQKIWPGAYEFEGTTVSTEYVDFTVNNLTSTFVMQKDTYKNLKYGEEDSNLKEEAIYIINHAKELIDNSIKLFYGNSSGWNPNSNFVDSNETLKKLTNSKEKFIYLNNNTAESIFNYVVALQVEKDGRQYYSDETVQKGSILKDYAVEGFCLTNQTIRRIDKDANLETYMHDSTAYYNLYGKTVAVNYYETEQGKDLYVYKNVTGENGPSDDEEYWDPFEYVRTTELSVFRTKNKIRQGVRGPVDRGQKIVYVNTDVDGNTINITEKEILEFVSMMNIDLYVRVVIYDQKNEKDYVTVAYYTDNSIEIAKEYGEITYMLNIYEESIKNIDKRYEDTTLTEEAKSKTIQDTVKLYKEKIEELKNKYKKFDNEEVVKNSKVPTVAQCAGGCIYKNGRYVVDIWTSSCQDNLWNIYDATECQAAKKIIAENKANNDAKRNAIVSKITNTKLTKDVEEYIRPKEEIQKEKNEEVKDLQQLENNDIVVLGIITGIVILLIVVLIIILMVNKKKNKKGGTNEEIY